MTNATNDRYEAVLDWALGKKLDTPNADFAKLLLSCDNIPFWCFDDKYHLKNPQKPRGCCFNHLVGLPLKAMKIKKKIKTVEHPIYDYEMEIFDALEENRHTWIKKSRGIGVTTFLIRYFAWKCLKDHTMQGKAIFIISGTREDFANEVKQRIEKLLTHNFHDIDLRSKYTELVLNGCWIKVFPTRSLKDVRGYTDVSYIFCDEADYFEPREQEELGFVLKSYEEKSGAQVIMASTPNRPDGLYAEIEANKKFKGFFEKIQLGYQRGLGKIYDTEFIKREMQEPEFEREYNLKYLGKIGNIFSPENIDLARFKGQDLMKRNPKLQPNKAKMHFAGMDQLGGGDSPAVIIIGEFDPERQQVDILKVKSYDKSWRHTEIADDVFDLYLWAGHNFKIYCDGARPDFINEIKTRFNEDTNWVKPYEVDINNAIIIPVMFVNTHQQMLSWTYNLMAAGKIAIPEGYTEEDKEEVEKLIIGLRTCWAKEWNMEKTKSVNDDYIDALRLMTKGIEFE